VSQLRRGFIDVHSHHYPDSYLDACRRDDSGFEHYVRDDGRLVVLQDGAVALAVPQPLPDLDHRLHLMDEAGVDLQVMSVSAPNVYRLPRHVRVPLTRDINDQVDHLASRAGGRLRMFASLPLPDVDVALEELDRAVALPSAVGVILTTTIDRHTLDDARFSPLWAELSRRQTVVFVHPTTGCCTEGVREFALSLALDFLAETTNAIARLVYSGTFERYPGIRWIFTHLGGTTPFLVHRFDNYARQFPENREHISRPPSDILRTLTFDTVTTHPAALRCAFETFGVESFVFGTDYPHVPGALQVFVDTLDAAGLGPEERELVGRTTAARLLGLGP
jgi:predicted TIM-barrel fold metal-dependent hydrolase